MIVPGKQWFEKLQDNGNGPPTHKKICLSPGWETENYLEILQAIIIFNVSRNHGDSHCTDNRWIDRLISINVVY